MAKEAKRASDPNLDEWGDPIPPPPIVVGYVHPKEGDVVTGVILSRSPGEKYGPYYVVKVGHPITVSQGGDYVSVPAGSNVGISEYTGLRPLADRMRSGPIRVRLHFKGKLPDKSWDLDVRAVPAF